jgi:glycosyltransferase involved in cell wall biosynthesis
MIERRKIDPRKLETFFFGIPLEDFTPSGDSVVNRKRRDLGLRPEQPVVCCVGRIDTQKGQRYLISAAEKVTEELPDVAFLIVGDGPELEQRQQQKERLGLEDTVMFAGHRDDVPDLLAMSDVMALPSLREGGPITLFEAMCVGKPVVGTPVGLMPDVIVDGRTGYLVPPKEVDPLASRLIDLLQDPDRADQMGNAAREAVKEYDMSRAVERLSEIYREVSRLGS